MDAAMNFLTTPAAAPRESDALGVPSGTPSSSSGAEFAGVLSGQMLKLERQSLATTPQESADLQVLRIGNKLNIITTDAPLPDMASLADFARAQGLGESAVRALFGNVEPQSTAALSIGLSNSGLSGDIGSPAQAAALAQFTAKTMVGAGVMQLASTPQSGLPPELAADAANAIGQSQALAQDPSAPKASVVLPTGLMLGASSLSLQVSATDAAAKIASDVKAAVAASDASVNGTMGQLEAFLAGRAIDGLRSNAANVSASVAANKAQVKTSAQLQAEALAALSAAVQAGLGMAAQASGVEGDQEPLAVTDRDSTVMISALSIENAGTNPAALGLVAAPPVSVNPVQMGEQTANAQMAAVAVSAQRLEAAARLVATELVQAHADSQRIQASADARALVADAAVDGEAAQAALQLRLIPPDRAITQRLAQVAGSAKAMDWSALLAGQKVSDTLTGLAQTPAPALSDAQAKLVAQMQVNGQLPNSGDEARNALLAKLQTQAARSDALRLPSAALGAPTFNAAKPTPAPMNLMATAPLATLAMGLTDTKLAPLPGPLQSAQLVQPAAPAPTAAPAASSSGLWETVRIEVPSGFALEALKASKDQKSNAEPDLPLAPSSTLSNNSAPSNAMANTAKAETATPQALAEQRAAQYQAMADQMGEAMARRLMAQIERGQWKMQMRMQPATLGRIDVELNMHAAGLDAKFSSDNAVTRELMAQGSAKLRDTLSQTGTTVASVTVNGDSGRQSGGNSTPGQKSKGTPSANSKKNAADPVVAAVAAPSATQSDGLNVLA